MRRIGILTSGGDSPGMNAAIAGAVAAANTLGIEIIGIRNGYDGLLDEQFLPLSPGRVKGINSTGGTILGTSRSERFMMPEWRKRIPDILFSAGIDGIMVVGGNGSLRGAMELESMGIRTVGIPGTIDNDLGGTDFTLGFMTAVETAVKAVRRLTDVALSERGIFIVEVMGRNSGYIALFVAMATGADLVNVPEQQLTTEEITAKLERIKDSAVVVWAEGCGDPSLLIEELKGRVTAPMAVAKIGYLQRGGVPSTLDSFLGFTFGTTALTKLVEGKHGIMIGIKSLEPVQVPYEEAVKPNPLPRFLQENLLPLLDIR